MIFWESRSIGARMSESFSFADYWYSLVFVFFLPVFLGSVFWLWRWMTKSARKGFEFGNHHCCDMEGRTNRPAVVL